MRRLPRTLERTLATSVLPTPASPSSRIGPPELKAQEDDGRQGAVADVVVLREGGGDAVDRQVCAAAVI